MDNELVSITLVAPGEWLIDVTRKIKHNSGQGKVVIRSTTHPDLRDPMHKGLAAARAWLGLGQKKVQEQKWDELIQATLGGVLELGEEYVPVGTRDDTFIKLVAADDMIERGQIKDGALFRLRLLESRINLYQKRYRDTIVR